MPEPASADVTARLDRWLWAARLFKTRAQAKTAIEGGHVQLNGARVKPSREVRVGMCFSVRRGDVEREVIVDAISDRRGPASVAATLYHETVESEAKRLEDAARRKMERAGLTVPETRPTKRDRRRMAAAKEQALDGAGDP